MKSSKFVNENNAQKQMAKFGFGCKFHDLKHFEIEICFHIFESI